MGDIANVVVEEDPDPSSSVEQITTFVDDSAGQVVSLPSYQAPSLGTLSSAMEARRHVIEDVLTRPVRVASGTWESAAAVASILVDLKFPQTLFQSVNLLKKLDKFTYFRGDVNIRVMANTSPFQSGQLLAFFRPYNDARGVRDTLNDSLTGLTALPNAILNAAICNTVEMTIPFVSPYSHLNLPQQIGQLGQFRIVVLNKLDSAAATSANYTVTAWFSNVSLEVPTAAPNAFTSSSKIKMSNLSQPEKFIVAYNDINTSLDFLTDSERSRLLEKLSKPAYIAQGESRTKTSSGIISSTLDTVSAVAATASSLPLVGRYFQPIEWISRAASQVAGYFGFNKPNSLESVSRFMQFPASGYTNAEGLDTSVSLSTMPDNSLSSKADLFGSNVDEMDIEFICNHSQFIQSSEWKTTTAAEATILEFPVSPGYCTNAKSPVTLPDFFAPTNMAYVASMFRYWRGDIRIKVQAVKTAYHSGRLRLSYIPGGVIGGTYVLDDAYSWYLDLKTSSEVEFEIPYNNHVPYKNTILHTNAAVDQKYSTGIFRISVVNTLVSPDTVTKIVPINIWLAGSNMSFAIPDFSRYIPSRSKRDLGNLREAEEFDPDYSPYEDFSPLDRLNSMLLSPPKPRYSAQVLGSFQDTGFNDFSASPHMFSMKSAPNLEYESLSIGERVQNLRSLTRRFAVEKSIAIADPNGKLGQLSFLGSAEDFGTAFDPNAVGAKSELFRVTPLSYISWLYTFYRGGIRVKANILTNHKGNLQITSLPAKDSIIAESKIIADTLTPSLLTPASFSSRVWSVLNNFIEVAFPFYSTTAIKPITAYDSTNPSLSFSDIAYNSYLLSYTNTQITQLTGTLEIYKAGADDFNCGWMQGAPTLLLRAP